jgi:hypothetical protein
MTSDEAQQAQDVVLGMFLASSHPATILFDSGASHSFISSSFIMKHNLPIATMKHTMLVSILRMYWLSKYDEVIQCARKAVRLAKKDRATVEFVAMVQPYQGSRLNQTKAMALEDIRVVQEYPNVFPEEMPGMPPDCDTEFLIELLPRTSPISKRSYRMLVNELVELKKQIAELSAKGFI